MTGDASASSAEREGRVGCGCCVGRPGLTRRGAGAGCREGREPGDDEHGVAAADEVVHDARTRPRCRRRGARGVVMTRPGTPGRRTASSLSSRTRASVGRAFRRVSARAPAVRSPREEASVLAVAALVGEREVFARDREDRQVGEGLGDGGGVDEGEELADAGGIVAPVERARGRSRASCGRRRSATRGWGRSRSRPRRSRGSGGRRPR